MAAADDTGRSPIVALIRIDGSRAARERTVARIVAAVQPHADAGKPRLWSLGAAADKGVAALPWPFERDLAAYPPDRDPRGEPGKPSQLRVVK